MSRTASRPRRQKKSAASRLRPFWILALVALFAGTVAAYVALTWHGFYPTRVIVVGNGPIAAAQILAAAKVDPQRNLWLQDARAMAKRVEAIPLVATASIHRGLPASVRIAVTLRAPAFALDPPGGRRYVLDRDLRVLYADDGATSEPAIVPSRPLAPSPGAFVSDPQVIAMRDDVYALRAAHADPVRLRYDRYESLIVTMRDGLVVLLGDDGEDLQKKIALLEPIRSQLAKGKPIAAIDLRAPNTPVVRYK